MPIRLVSDDERLSYQVGDSTIYYRRAPAHVYNRIVDRNTKRGQTHWGRAQFELLEWAILGWDNVIGPHDDQVPFEPEHIRALPGDTRNDLIDRIWEESPGGSTRKNSGSSSTASAP